MVSGAAEEVVEIDESEHSEVDITEGSPAAPDSRNSPLFVSPGSPSDLDHPVIPSVAIHNPEPPSSYLAGAYEVVDSSQANESSSAPNHKDPPESSQYVPDPGDTTTTTEDTTAITVAQTTPSEPPRSLPVNFSESSNGIVPDTQAPNGSASYNPPTATSTSSSAPQLQVDVISSQPASIPHREDEAQDQTSSSAPASNNPVVQSEDVLHSSNAESVTQSETGPRSETAATNQKQDNPIPGPTSQVFASTSANDLIAQEEQPELESPLRSVRSLQGSPTRDTTSTQPDLSEQPESQVVQQQDSEAQQSRKDIEEAESATANHTSSTANDEQPQAVGPSQARSVVEITSTAPEPPTLGSPFEVTPPPRRAFNDGGNTIPRNLVDSSAWLGPSSQYHTQVPISPRVEGTSAFLGSPSEEERPQSSPLKSGHSQLTQFSTIPPRASSVPAGQYSPVQSLSFIPYPPLESIEEGALPISEQQPDPTPSTPDRKNRTMDQDKSTPRSAQSLRAKISEIRAQARPGRRPQVTPTSIPPAKVADHGARPSATFEKVANIPPANAARLGSPFLLVRESARSPSVVPAQAPLPVITQKEMNTSARYETLLPQSQEANNSADQTRSESFTAEPALQSANADDDDPETASMHIIPITFSGHQRDQYSNLVWYHRETISEFLRAQFLDKGLMQKANRFVQRVRNVAMHPDLDNSETLTQYSVEASQQAEWDVRCSAKFQFLQELVHCFQGQPIRLVVLSNPGRIIDMLDTFFKGLGLPPTRVDPEDNELIHSGTEPEIILLSTEDETETDHSANLVIAMDANIEHDTRTIRDFRREEDVETWCPFVKLVVPHTVEHVLHGLAPNLSDKAHTRALVNGIYHFRANASKPWEGQRSVKESADLLARYIKKVTPEWPLAGLEPLEDLDSQTESEIDLPATNGTVDDMHASAKRSREPEDAEEEEDAEASKRARLGSADESGDLDAMHVSDSIGKATQSNALGETAQVEPSSVYGHRTSLTRPRCRR